MKRRSENSDSQKKQPEPETPAPAPAPAVSKRLRAYMLTMALGKYPAGAIVTASEDELPGIHFFGKPVAGCLGHPRICEAHSERVTFRTGISNTAVKAGSVEGKA